LFPKAAEPAITEEEFLDIIETAEEEGVLDKDKQELVNSALNFDVITAGDIYTGRDKILALDVNSTYQEILQVIKTHKYSRLPVYQDSLDNIVGILHARDFLKCYLRQEKPDIRELLIDVHFVSEKTRIDDLLRDMSSKKIHMSVVTDGSGKTLGIVTVEDILEELVGEIFDEDDVAHEKHARLSVKQPESSYRPKALNVAKAPNAAKTLIAEKATDVAKMPDAAKMPITAKTPDAAKATNFARALNAAKSPDTAKAQYSTSAPDATKAPDSAKGTDVAKTPNATIAMN
jgi:Mg2+/Co2+ transporter CorC